MFEASELVNLIVGGCSISFLVPLLKNIKNQWLKKLLIGYSLILCAFFFTFVEGFFMQNIFNVLEHLFYAFSGIVFAYACINISKADTK